LAASTRGCTLVLTGDYHWTDVKVLREGGAADAYYGVGRGAGARARLGPLCALASLYILLEDHQF